MELSYWSKEYEPDPLSLKSNCRPHLSLIFSHRLSPSLFRVRAKWPRAKLSSGCGASSRAAQRQQYAGRGLCGVSDAGPATACKLGSGRRRLAQQWLRTDRGRAARRRQCIGREPGSAAGSELPAAHKPGSGRRQRVRRGQRRGRRGADGGAQIGDRAAQRWLRGRRRGQGACSGAGSGAATVGHERFFYFSKNNLPSVRIGTRRKPSVCRVP